MTSLVVVSAGVSTPSSTRLLADQIAQSVSDRLRVADVSATSTVLELRDLAMDITSATLSAGRRSPQLERANASLAAADAVLAVTPVFAGSYSGLFKSFFDTVEPGALRATPVLVAATGGSERHSLVLEHALRPLFAYFGALVMPTGVFAATADFGAQPAGAGGLSARIGRAAEELSSLVVTRAHVKGDHELWADAPRRDDDLSETESLEATGALSDFEALLPPSPRVG